MLISSSILVAANGVISFFFYGGIVFHCTLPWKIPWTEEPGRLQSMGSRRAGYDWVTSLSLFTFMHWRRKWQPTPVFFCLENPRDGDAWWAAIYGVAQSQTGLKWLSSSSSSVPLYICTTSSLSIHLLMDTQVVNNAAVNIGVTYVFLNYSFVWMYAQEWDCWIMW